MDYLAPRQGDWRDSAVTGHGRYLLDLVKAGLQQFKDLAAGITRKPDAQAASWSLPPRMSSVPRARHLARARLSSWGLDEPSDVVELLVSELVTNALCHAHEPYRLTLFASDGLLRCEVEDSDPTLPHLCHAADDDEHGRGLALLDLLACCWGCERTRDGKTVWFELPTGNGHQHAHR
ncbi:ATP-binding protein [Nonomuraea sp. NPDC000554]|uniref:ATP-binding protein n=1 Tax=Nonomuraea sp. NPDC000554 TaxID=3154259 RepID=UPI003323FBD7